MKALLAALVMLGVTAGQALAQKAQPERAPDPIVEYDTADAAMNAARAAAQRSYGQFLADFRAATPHARANNYMVKLGLDRSDGGLEHIWVDTLRFEGDQLVGALANEPVDLPSMHVGSRVVVETERISDWSIVRAEGMYGNFTTRVMLPDVDPATAAELREVLTRDPLPEDWSS